MPERATRDMDVIVAAEDIAVARELLSNAGWQCTGDLTIGGTSWQSPDGKALDVLEGHSSWWPQAIAEAQTNLDTQGLPILPLPYLVLMKFQSGRTVDIGDITRILGQADAAALDATRQLFQRHETEGLEDLESLILLGRLEMDESEQASL